MAGFLLALREADDPANTVGARLARSDARDFTALGSNGVLVFAVIAACLFLARERATAFLPWYPSGSRPAGSADCMKASSRLRARIPPGSACS
jgi:hypothetical protein